MTTTANEALVINDHTQLAYLPAGTFFTDKEDDRYQALGDGTYDWNGTSIADPDVFFPKFAPFTVENPEVITNAINELIVGLLFGTLLSNLATAFGIDLTEDEPAEEPTPWSPQVGDTVALVAPSYVSPEWNGKRAELLDLDACCPGEIRVRLIDTPRPDGSKLLEFQWDLDKIAPVAEEVEIVDAETVEERPTGRILRVKQEIGFGRHCVPVGTLVRVTGPGRYPNTIAIEYLDLPEGITRRNGGYFRRYFEATTVEVGDKVTLNEAGAKHADAPLGAQGTVLALPNYRYYQIAVEGVVGVGTDYFTVDEFTVNLDEV